ncbi:defender against death DAD protein [Violaceomyces palustris]|uniref:Defender against death DAD protein n=1 Tax=Violaceomyces palustris TaxID=1673888 RepID=A0ACD0P6D8_9BASI|nr:defender against death DAD protein [Violaceomyces palustris]
MPSTKPASMPARTKSNRASTSSSSALSTLYSSYRQTTPTKLKLIDSFMAFLVLSGVIQFAYCVLITNFPFNSFIAGFASTVGQFVLLASLRIQSNPENSSEFPKVSPERAFGDFLFGSVILHFFVVNFLG